MQCLRCGGEMKSFGRQDIQLGQHSFFFGDLDNLLSGSLETEIFICRGCGKVELFSGEGKEEERFSQKLKREKPED